VLLVIDEAQNLSVGALEELRMLSNLETEKSKLLQILLVGQPNLREKLDAPELEQLRQRITVGYHLRPLGADETTSYINHRLRRAAIGVPFEFPRDVTGLIHHRSRGVPRIVNVICDAVLVFGYAEERRQIDLSLTSEVLTELEGTGILKPADGVLPPAPVRTVHAAAPTVHAAAPTVRAAAPIELAVAASAAAQTLSAELDLREQTLRQRERELVDQRRILAEEYRLLRMHGPQSSAHPIRVQLRDQARPAPARFTPGRTVGFWARFKRIMLGNSAPATGN
jgi:hypothetical protein